MFPPCSPRIEKAPAGPSFASRQGGATTIVHWLVIVPVAKPDESTTLAVKLKEPDDVGVPVIAPVLGFKARPGGRLPAVMENVNGGSPPVVVSAEL
jgi:hypothetical protein